MIRQQDPITTLEAFFNPKSIAVIGASGNPLKPGGVPIGALLKKGYSGKIYPVNPTRETLNGLKCYPSVLDIPGEVDLAIVSVAADRVYHTLEECVSKGVKAAIIFSSGFAEVSTEGLAEQRRITALAVKSGMRILGPNCLGIVNATNGVMASFAFIVDLPPVDPKVLGFVTQSGAFGALIYAASLHRGVGFNYFISVGNEADLEFADFLQYLVRDPATKLAGGYLEGAKDGNKLRKVAEEALEKEKPLLIMKVGRSSAGSRAAASHTGSLVGSDRVYEAFFKQTGIIRVDDYTELIAFSPLFQTGKLPGGRNTAIIAASGGAGVTITDFCESLGLNVIPLREETRAKMDRVLPSFASSRNPVDLTAALATNPELIPATLRAISEDPDIDIIIAYINFHVPPEHPVIQEVIDICKKTDKFVLISPFILPGTSMDPGTMKIKNAGIPVNSHTREAIKAVANLVRYSETLRKRKQDIYRVPPPAGQKPDLSGLLIPGETLSESSAKAVLQKYGIPVTREAPASSAGEAVEKAREIGYPVVLKIDSPDIPHKTEAGGLKLNLKNDGDVRTAFEEIVKNVRVYKPDARINGVSVQEMLPEGTEVIVGVSRDPVFGPVIMFGLGGIFVEVLKDVSFRIAPLSPGDARDMIEEIKGCAVLKGVRGKPPADIDAVVDVILKVSALVTDYQDSIEELDINPLVVYPKGVKAADAMLVTRKGQA
ncbi:MAG: acetate--CoA ligase family protein [Peptococcaceae bacterium]|nr:acetate--CoA ligase family protein [Peptococcaceae bacterium]